MNMNTYIYVELLCTLYYKMKEAGISAVFQICILRVSRLNLKQLTNCSELHNDILGLNVFCIKKNFSCKVQSFMGFPHVVDPYLLLFCLGYRTIYRIWSDNHICQMHSSIPHYLHIYSIQTYTYCGRYKPSLYGLQYYL